MIDSSRSSNRKISTTGLTLREFPNLSAKKLDVAPFVASVEFIDIHSHGVDTVGTHVFYYGEISVEKKVVGHWRHVKHKGQTGLMFGAYLTEVYQNVLGKKEGMALLFPYSSCDNNFLFHPEWKWFALFKTKDPNNYEWRKVSLHFCVLKDDIMDSYCIAANKTDKDILCIVGSLQNLEEVNIQGKWFSPEEGYLFDSSQEKAIPRVDFFKPWGLQVDSLSFYGTAPLYIKNGERRQLLNAQDPESNQAIENPSSLKWVGDLDGDGKRDYLIHYGIDKSSTHILYLSSKAQKGALVKKAASFWMGPCC